MTRRPIATRQPEPEYLLRSLPYVDYRNSVWWKQRRDRYRETVKEKGGKNVLYCELCMIAVFVGGNVPWHVHHISYERLGAETDDDLLHVCSPCHNLIHFPESHAAQHWHAHVLAEHNLDLEDAIALACAR